MDLYFFKNRSCHEVAVLAGMTHSSTHRMIQRSLEKLRAAAQRRKRRPEKAVAAPGPREDTEPRA